MSTDVVEAPKSEIKSVGDLIKSESFKVEIQKAAPKHIDADQLLRVAWTSIRKNPKLSECTVSSMASSLLEISSMGLKADGVIGEAYLVPFANKKKGTVECTPMIGFRGLMKLARNGGEVVTITADEVYTCDKFKITKGTEQSIKHEPDYNHKDRTPDNVIGVYAVATLKSGEKQFDYMSRSDIERIRKMSRGKDAEPWTLHWVEMAKKTVIRRLCKMLPLSSDIMKFIGDDSERDNPRQIHDPDAIDTTAEVAPSNVEELTKSLSGEPVEGVGECPVCKEEKELGPEGNCSPCQSLIDADS